MLLINRVPFLCQLQQHCNDSLAQRAGFQSKSSLTMQKKPSVDGAHTLQLLLVT